jgi:hypothetical protein
MSQHGIKLSRPQNALPVELRQRNSDLDVLISLAGTAAENQSFGFQSQVRVARRLIRQNCSSYRPSTAFAEAVVCGSGEKDGTPAKGSQCFTCRAGQFSQSGFFTGEEQPPQSPRDCIVPPWNDPDIQPAMVQSVT